MLDSRLGFVAGVLCSAAFVLGAPQRVSAQTGTGRVEREVRLGNGTGGFSGALANAVFGGGVARIGDLDGDGVTDIAVGAAGYDGGKGAVYVLFLNADGTIKAQRTIAESQGGLAGTLEAGDRFGYSVAGIGDLDGDSIPDLAVGATGVDEGTEEEEEIGAVFVLFLNADGTVKAQHRIDVDEWAFGGTLAEYAQFGTAVDTIGDVNGDGIADLAVGAAWDSSVVYAEGSIYILLMNADGTVAAAQKISAVEGGFTGSLGRYDLFGISLAGTGDLDGDGVPDLAVGAEHDDDGASFNGAVWLLHLTAAGTVKSHAKISATAGGFKGTIKYGEHFGSAVAAPGDVDGDGVRDLIVGQYTYVPGRDERPLGGAWILLLNPDETVKAHRVIADGFNGFTGPHDVFFGWAVAPLGDLDSDGALDFVVGAPLDDGGAAWIVFLGEDPDPLCGAAPSTSCVSAERARLVLRAKLARDGRDRLDWTWQGPPASFGAPQLGTAYALCVWDSVSSVPLFKTDLVIPPGPPWTSVGADFRYRDDGGSAEGVTNVSLREGSRIKLKASGLRLPTPLPFASDAYFALEPALTVQLVNGDGSCWSAEFHAAKSSTNLKFVAQSP